MSSLIAESATFTGGQVVVFDLGGQEYALPIDQVREVIRFSNPRRVSHNPLNLGVINLRGKLVPVADLASCLGAAASADREETKIVVIEAADGTSAGVVVDDVKEVLWLAAEQIEPLPSEDENPINAIAKIDNRLVALIDAPRLLEDVQH